MQYHNAFQIRNSGATTIKGVSGEAIFDVSSGYFVLKDKNHAEIKAYHGSSGNGRIKLLVYDVNYAGPLPNPTYEDSNPGIILEGNPTADAQCMNGYVRLQSKLLMTSFNQRTYDRSMPSGPPYEYGKSDTCALYADCSENVVFIGSYTGAEPGGANGESNGQRLIVTNEDISPTDFSNPLPTSLHTYLSLIHI